MSSWTIYRICSIFSGRLTGLIGYSVGLVLLTICIVDATKSNPSLVVANFSPTGNEATGATPYKRLWDYIEQAQTEGRFQTREATSLVHFATRHIPQRNIKFTENWMQWCLGQFYPPLLQTQDTQRLIDGRLGNCSERCQILKYVAESAGHSCRFVGLSGHVVLEIETDGKWVTADPDYNVVFPLPVADLDNEDGEKIIRASLASRFPRPIVDRYVEIFLTEENNLHLDVGSPLSPRLYMAERICRFLSWLIPSLALGCIVPVIRAGNRKIAASRVEQHSRSIVPIA